MTLDFVPGYSGFKGGPIAGAYNEAAFKYFLDVDRRRVERSSRSIALVLVSVRSTPGRSAELPDDVASELFAGLVAGVREVDFVGWHRHRRVAGAVLPQAGDASREMRQQVAKRILACLRKSVRQDVASRLHVRVVRLAGKAQR